MKQGIIVVNKGTADYEVRNRTLDEFVLSIGDRLEDAEISLVFTDGDIRKNLRDIAGEKVQNLKAAILGMKERGITDLLVVSTDIHDGPEYKKLKEETVGLASLFRKVNISVPLLCLDSDYELTARAFLGAFKDIAKDSVLVVLAEGHKSDGLEELKAFQTALAKHFPASFVATLNGEKKPYKIIKELKTGIHEGKRIVLVPMEFIAGETVENAVSQEYTDFVLRLEGEGYEVEPVFKGLAEYADFQRLYLRHIYDAIR